MFNLTFTAEDMQVINDALITQPYGKVAYLINKINEQIADRRVKKEEEKDEI